MDGGKTRVLLFIIALVAVEVAAGGGGWSQIHGEACKGSMAECGLVEDEAMMGSEIHRRILQQASGRHIDYGALNPDRPVCDGGKGQSYAGRCAPARSGNPYSGGCSAYHQCRIG